MPVLYHVSPRWNRRGILHHGLLLDMSLVKARGIWLASLILLPWALNHVRDRHGCPDVDVYRVRAAWKYLRRRRHGIYLCTRSILPLELSLISEEGAIT